MEVGNVSFNPEAFKDWTKEQFIEAYKGKLTIDINQVWENICKENGSINEPSKESKKSKRRGVDDGFGE